MAFCGIVIWVAEMRKNDDLTLGSALGALVVMGKVKKEENWGGK